MTSDHAPFAHAGRRIAVIGGGWAGLACAVEATRLGHAVTLFEASRQWGGRARCLTINDTSLPGGSATVDNGQHILIGAYTETLTQVQAVGLQPSELLTALPLALRFPDGNGLSVPTWARRWPAALGIGAAGLRATGWSWRERWAFLVRAGRWRAQHFTCEPHQSVADLCVGLPARVMEEWVEPLCVAALNTPAHQASGKVWLRILQDALLGAGHGPWRSSDLLLPRVDLGQLYPEAAAAWLQRHGAKLQTGHRVDGLDRASTQWLVDGHLFDAVVLTCPVSEAIRLTGTVASQRAGAGAIDNRAAVQHWRDLADALRHAPIATVYALHDGDQAWPGPWPMLALRSGPSHGPAQFVFDRQRLGGPRGLLAFVVSDSHGGRAELEHATLAQGRRALGLLGLRAVQTVVEKRATFACTPGLQRPPGQIADGLWAAGDYIASPYPATLEGAVRSGIAAAAAITPAR